MKKHILNVAAIILAVSASAFTTNHDLTGKKLTSYKWFRINTNKAPSASVLNSDATYLGEGEDVPTIESCDDTNTYQCVSGFTAGTQVNGSNQIVGSQAPAMVGHTRN